MDCLEQIPGVGPRIAENFRFIGINKVEDLKDKNPEYLYEKLQSGKCTPFDRCVLYVFRCAVYFASTKKHDIEKLKWWNWKDKK